MKGSRMRRALAGLITALAFLHPPAVFAQSAVPAPPLATQPAIGMMQLHPALWKIEKGPHTVYLFGSLHILPDYTDWTAPEIDAAMQASDIFVFEAQVDEEAAELEKEFVIKNGLLPGSLRQLLSRREYLIYSTILIRAGLKAQQFEHY